jgi:hypothetical protein
MVKEYIDALNAYKKMGRDSIDDAIVLAETILIATEEIQRRKDYEAGGKAGFAAVTGKLDFLTFEEYSKMYYGDKWAKTKTSYTKDKSTN